MPPCQLFRLETTFMCTGHLPTSVSTRLGSKLSPFHQREGHPLTFAFKVVPFFNYNLYYTPTILRQKTPLPSPPDATKITKAPPCHLPGCVGSQIRRPQPSHLISPPLQLPITQPPKLSTALYFEGCGPSLATAAAAYQQAYNPGKRAPVFGSCGLPLATTTATSPHPTTTNITTSPQQRGDGGTTRMKTRGMGHCAIPQECTFFIINSMLHIID